MPEYRYIPCALQFYFTDTYHCEWPSRAKYLHARDEERCQEPAHWQIMEVSTGTLDFPHYTCDTHHAPVVDDYNT